MLLAAFALFPGTTLAQPNQCGENAPGYPVPEFRGATRLWPTSGFRPGRPGQVLPPDRDSTQYISTPFPSAATGFELFWALDVVGDRAFVMYNVGISVWDIGGIYAENPRRLVFRDGLYPGHWLFHDGDGESDGVLEDIAAMVDPANPNRILITVSASGMVGASIWRYDRVTGDLRAIYQDTQLEGEDVEMIVFGGRLYALIAASTGAFVLDVSATNALPEEGCLDGACPAGIYLGKVGAARGSRYVGAIERGGKVYLAASNGAANSFRPPPEIWELDPAHPEAAVLRFSGPVNETHSPILFVKDGIHYMAVVEAARIKIYDVGNCLDGNGCSSLPAPSFDHALRPQLWSYDYLTYSLSEGIPFLYYGFEGAHAKGAAYERLFDLSNLGTPSPITEITETGQTYTDGCHGLGPIGYWADYYEYNDHGFRNYNPRRGKFAGRYFYKVNTGTFDVHVRDPLLAPPPAVSAAATSPSPYYFGDAVSFAATAQNCAGAEIWTWLASNGNAAGLGVGVGTAAINWNLCPESRCPSENIEVWAIKAACAGAGNLSVSRATVSVADPRPTIAALVVTPAGSPADTYPVGSVLDFSAQVAGKAPLAYAWTVRSPTQQVLLQGSSATLTWNTTGAPVGPEIFADGFESGDTTGWDIGRQAEREVAARHLLAEVRRAGSATFTVELKVTNSTGSPASLSRAITLFAPSPLE